MVVPIVDQISIVDVIPIKIKKYIYVNLLKSDKKYMRKSLT